MMKLYLDTSVISHLDAPDTPEKMSDTLRFWQNVMTGLYEICISDITIAEIDRCAEPKRTFMLKQLFSVKPIELTHNDDAKKLTTLYISVGGLPPKSVNDAQHIAIATVHHCDAIISWNFKHIVNLRAMTAVEAVNVQQGYAPLRILSPTMILFPDPTEETNADT
jgi:predicted nucleic acid-binding protein